MDRAQGWYISPPLPVEEADDLLARTVKEENHLDKILHDRMEVEKNQVNR